MYQFLCILEAAAKPESAILALDASLLQGILFQWINTALLIFILTKLLYNPVKDFMQKRADRIANQLSDAETHLADAMKQKAEYETKLRDIESERVAILEQARKRAMEKGDEIIAEARREAESIRSRAMSDIQMEQERVKDDVRKQMIEISSLLAGRFVAVSLDKDAHDKLIADTLKELEGVTWHK